MARWLGHIVGGGFLMGGPRLEEHEVVVSFMVATTHEDVQAALERSGIILGSLIGEALIMDVEAYSPEEAAS